MERRTGVKSRGDLSPAETTYRRAFAQALQETGRPDDAETELLRVLTLEPDDADSLLILGNIFQLQRKFDVAEPLYRHALGIKRTPYVLSSLGALLGNIGRLREAITLFDEAIRLDPTYAKAHLGRKLAITAQERSPPGLA